MPARALIVAIEDYGGSQTLHGRLEGTNDAARAFHAWLTGTKRVDPAGILCCGDASLPFRTAGTTRADVVSQIRRLRDEGKDQTEELYVFFSGHGFTFSNVAGRAPLDVLVAADFVRPEDSGGACIQLGELQEKLRFALGPGDHYYFVDACRNPLPAESIDVPTLGVVLGTSNLGQPTWYTLYSTAPGATADVRSGFAQALTRGLSGRGRAKTWQRGRLWVTFELLCSYVKAQLRDRAGQEVDSDKKGPGEGLIHVLEPPPNSRCQVRVEGAAAADTFTLTLRTDLGTAAEESFTGDTHMVEVKPFDYYLEVAHPAAEVEQVEPPPVAPVDLFDEASVRFRMGARTRSFAGGESGSPPAGPPEAAPAEAEVRVAAPDSVVVSLTNLETGDSVDVAGGSAPASLQPGVYRMKMHEHGVTLAARRMTVPSGGSLSLDLPTRELSGVHRSILERISFQAPDAGVAYFSETLGPTANPDLGLWLSLLGAARVVAGPREFSKLAEVPLMGFGGARPGDAPVYALAAFAEDGGDFALALDGGAAPAWTPFRPVAGMESVREHLFPTAPGPHLLSFQAPGRAPRTYAVHTLPNRATLVTFSAGEAGALDVHQYILPLHPLLGELDGVVLGRIPEEPLPVVRAMYAAQKQFARQRAIGPRLRESAAGARVWEDLTYTKWLDPVMSLIAAHELVRTRPLEEVRGLLRTIVGNLRRFFPGMADAEALALRAGVEPQPVRALPLLLDSAMAFEAAGVELDAPLPMHRIDFASS